MLVRGIFTNRLCDKLFEGGGESWVGKNAALKEQGGYRSSGYDSTKWIARDGIASASVDQMR